MHKDDSPGSKWHERDTWLSLLSHHLTQYLWRSPPRIGKNQKCSKYNQKGCCCSAFVSTGLLPTTQEKFHSEKRIVSVTSASNTEIFGLHWLECTRTRRQQPEDIPLNHFGFLPRAAMSRLVRSTSFQKLLQTLNPVDVSSSLSSSLVNNVFALADFLSPDVTWNNSSVMVQMTVHQWSKPGKHWSREHSFSF